MTGLKKEISLNSIDKVALGYNTIKTLFLKL